MTKRQTITKAFKAEAVRLLEQSGKPAADLDPSGGRVRGNMISRRAVLCLGESILRRHE